MGFLQRVYDRLMSWTVPLQSLVLLLIRLIWGWQFMWIGWGKLTNLSATAEFFESVGIPNAETMASVVGGIEFGCGILLFLGLISRLASLPLVIVMIGAYISAHTEAVISIFSDFEMFTSQAPFLFLYASLIVLCFGPGKLSLDYLLRSKGD